MCSGVFLIGSNRHENISAPFFIQLSLTRGYYFIPTLVMWCCLLCFSLFLLRGIFQFTGFDDNFPISGSGFYFDASPGLSPQTIFRKVSVFHA